MHVQNFGNRQTGKVFNSKGTHIHRQYLNFGPRTANGWCVVRIGICQRCCALVKEVDDDLVMMFVRLVVWSRRHKADRL